MQTKFESKSNRVKGLCFHPNRPWILSSLHNGAVQLFDYRNKCLIHSFEEHDGPVRGVDFHTSQPLFVSGGDDYKIKVWNYKLKRCLFTLLGHLDYVRTVKFHQEQPWILSASDDQTIRLWNWQSRTSISTLTGHNHYVMSAFFHPQDPLIVSASLDNSVRVWDISPIMKSSPSMSNDLDLAKINSDIFGSNEVSVKFTLEGHERGVNWANFHPTLPLIVSGADDRQIKIWRMNETNAWEVDTLKGHVNNVSSVAFHPNKDLIISNAEDRSIKVWDTSRRVCIQTYKRENDRFWVLATHPTKNIVAAGHDSGMMVFSLDRERPANFSTLRETYYIKEQRFLRCYQYAKASEDLVLTLPRVDKSFKSPKYLLKNNFSAPNESKGTFLIFYDKSSSDGVFQLVTPKNEDVFEGTGLDVIFISRNRFAVLEKNSRISVRNFNNEVTKRIQPNISQIENIYGTPINGRILIKSSERLHLYDIQARKLMAEYYIQNVKKVYYDKYITVITKNSITILDKNLTKLVSIQETSKIKSVLWNASNTVLYYTTLCQIKYLIVSSQDRGILKSISETLYLTKVVEKSDYECKIYGITKDSKFLTIPLNISEISFKLSLESKKFGKVMKIIKNNKLEGKSIINYLYQKSLPSVALHFVTDLKMKFKLAISCSNLKIAMETCLAINEEEYFETLAKEALMHGNVTIVEMCYQKIRNFEKLNFLYLITGEKEKLNKMYKIAENRNDVVQQFNLSLLLNKVKERISLLEKCGQYGLAYVTAVRNNLPEERERIEKRMIELDMKLPNIEAIDQWSQNTPMKPVPCLVPDGSIKSRNWPLKEVNRGVVYDALMKGIDLMDDTELIDNQNQSSEEEEYFEAEEEEEKPLFSDDDEFDAQDDELEDELEGGGWNNEKEDDDLDFGAELQSPVEKNDSFISPDKNNSSEFFEMPKRGIDIQAVWQQSSSLAIDHIAAGNFQSAKELLRRQIGVENFQPLLPKIRQIYLGATMALSTIPNVSSITEPLVRNVDRLDLSNNDHRLKSFAVSPYSLDLLQSKLKTGKNLFQAGKFREAIQEFRDILYSVPFVVVEKNETSEVSQLISSVKEYLLGLLIELKRREATDPKRALELAVYFSNCKLEPKHMILVLNTAMKAAYKLKNYITAVHLAQKLLALNEFNQENYADKKKIAQKVLKKSEMNATNAFDIDFRKDEDFNVCVVSLTPIYSGEKFVKCPFTKAHAKPEFKGQVSPLCGISILGKETLGLLCSD